MTQWGIVYETVDNTSADLIKNQIISKIDSLFAGGKSHVIPGLHIFNRENDKSLANMFTAVQLISANPQLKGKIKKLRLIRLTDNANMIPALDKQAVAPLNDYHYNDYGSMQ